MSNLKLLRKILRLKSLKIICFWFQHRETELHLAVKPYKTAAGARHVGGAAGLCTTRPSFGGGRILPSWA